MPRQQQKTIGSASDYVVDPFFGVVPKDVDAMIRLREEAAAQGAPDPVAEVPLAVQEKLAK